MRKATLVLVSLFAFGLAGGCASSVRREVTVPGSAPTVFDLSREDAALADRYERDAPSDPEAACLYWKRMMTPTGSHREPCARDDDSAWKDLLDWCSAKQTASCAAGSASCSAPLAKPERRYLAEQTSAETVGADAVRADYADPTDLMNPPPDSRTRRLLKNSSVEVVRYLRNMRADDKSACPFALVRIVDAGGVADAGSLFRVPRTVLVEEASGAPPAEQVKEREQKRAEANRRMVEAEIASGKCSDAHVDFLRRGLAVTKNYLDANRGDMFDVGDHAFVVGTTERATLTLGSGLGGELHVFAVAFEPFTPSGTTFELLDDQGYAVKTESRMTSVVAMAFGQPTEGFVLQANRGKTLRMKLAGHGCVLLFSVRHY